MCTVNEEAIGGKVEASAGDLYRRALREGKEE